MQLAENDLCLFCIFRLYVPENFMRQQPLLHDFVEFGRGHLDFNLGA